MLSSAIDFAYAGKTYLTKLVQASIHRHPYPGNCHVRVWKGLSKQATLYMKKMT